MRVRKIAKQLKRFYESDKGWDKEMKWVFTPIIWLALMTKLGI